LNPETNAAQWGRSTEFTGSVIPLPGVSLRSTTGGQLQGFQPWVIRRGDRVFEVSGTFRAISRLDMNSFTILFL
jgi:hypothetical protein